MKGSSIFDIKSVRPSLGVRRNLPMKTRVSLTTNLAARLHHHNFCQFLPQKCRMWKAWFHLGEHTKNSTNRTFTKIKMEALLWSRKIFNLYQLITCTVLTLFCWGSLVHIDHTIHELDAFLKTFGKPHRHTASRCHADLFICLLDILLDPCANDPRGPRQKSP